MTCVDLIKKNISDVQFESREITIPFETVINKHLDTILSFQQDIRRLTEMIDELTERLHIDFLRLTSDNVMEIREDLKNLILELVQLYVLFRKSILYEGAKTFIKEFHSSIDSLREVTDDLEAFKISLPAKQEFIQVINRINAL